jgi:peptide/nickel transport system ATP-binding protein
MTNGELVLDVRDLMVGFGQPPLDVVRGVTFSVRGGERVAVVGESGSGKSVTALSLVGLVPHAHVRGSVRLEGTELVGAHPRVLQCVRGRRVGFVFQDPLSALNPTMRIGDQVAETLTVHGVSRRDAHVRVRDMLARVGIRDVDRVSTSFPHQLSGGMRQRTVIAAALISRPALLIADEPTTALDAHLRLQVISLLRDLAANEGAAVIFITHDLNLMAGFADRVLVMYGGRFVEDVVAAGSHLAARHPYTRALLASVPNLGADRAATLPAIPGSPPVPGRIPAGCPFAPRCSLVVDACRGDEPPLRSIEERHRVACLRAEDTSA